MVQVHISDGILEGESLRNEYGGVYYSFKGIPYAEPPLGELRFKPPEPVKPWDGIRNVKQFGPICYQLDFFTRSPPGGSEDCLYLNVYTPELKPSKLLPVMIWIHGGGFFWGSGNDDLYGPEFLIRHSVILVTFNYRLGAFGFLSLESKEIPGNVGMKDQVAAIKWVRKNICNFGGDPENITIFGESAGGASVAFHLISPMTRGLFKRAILQSGSANAHWALNFEPRERALKIANKLGLYSEDDKELYQFFKRQPKEAFLSVEASITFAEKEKFGIYFSVVSEKDFGQERFFYGDLKEALKNGVHEGVDVMSGYVEDEGLLNFVIMKDLKNINVFENINFREALVPVEITKHCSIKDQLEIGRVMKKFYFNKCQVTKDDWEQVSRHAGFDVIIFPILEFMKTCALSQSNKLYLYKFTCKSERNFFAEVFDLGYVVGDKQVVCHCDELSYLFPIKFMNRKLVKDSQAFELMERVTKLWTNFATKGNPTPDTSLGVRWEPYDLHNESYLNIGEQLVLGSHPEREELEFWENIFKRYLPRKSL